MPVFAYQAKDNRGQTMSGTIEANTQEAVLEMLAGRGLALESITTREGLEKKRGAKVKTKDVIIFTRQLATMIDAGLPLMECLSILEAQAESVGMRKVTSELRDQIEKGASFSEALASHPKVFTQLYTCMVKAGEKGGFLPEVLARVAGYLEANARLAKKVKSAMAYPVIVMILALGITSFLVFYMLPFFKELYGGLGSKLPGPTQMLMDISDFCRQKAPLAIGIVVAGWYAFSWAKKTGPGREVWDRLKLKFPVFGKLMLKVELARFLRTFASLVKAGVPILDVLEIVGGTSGNILVIRACKDANTSIQQGQTISASLAKHPVFPPMMVRMLGAGEVTGRVDTMLEKVAEFYEEEVEAMLSALASMIEPLLICVIGAIVGTIVICLFLPILKLSEAAAF